MGTIPLWKSNILGSKYEEVDEDSPLPIQQVYPPAYVGGLLTFSITCLNSANLTLIKNLPGQVFGWAIYNSSATVPAKVTLYDKGGAAPVIASDVGLIKLRIGVPSTATGGGNNIIIPGPYGIQFLNGIGIATVTAAAGTLADTDSTAPAAGTLQINIFYL